MLLLNDMRVAHLVERDRRQPRCNPVLVGEGERVCVAALFIAASDCDLVGAAWNVAAERCDGMCRCVWLAHPTTPPKMDYCIPGLFHIRLGRSCTRLVVFDSLSMRDACHLKESEIEHEA